ncbi:MAG: peptidase M17 [Deltaproteobacteria bacterium CG11_big_fil_rev_8_21_14_0_20_45_16]|nr:MAG: peptidase M17 [Deltaproteobacteria bacterium CG11_big_fil_rev_8_21_14_0_20_45_16]
MQIRDHKIGSLKGISDRSVQTLIIVGELKHFEKSRSYLKLLPIALQARLREAHEVQKEEWKAGHQLWLPSFKKDQPNILVLTLGEELSSYAFLTMARKALKQSLVWSHQCLGLVFLDAKHEENLADAFGAASSARVFEMPLYGKREKDRKKFALKEVHLFASRAIQKSFSYGMETGEGSNLVRYLGTLPGNRLQPGEYGRRIREFCKKYKLGLKFYSKSELKKMGAGGFIAVDQGDPDSYGGVYEITYSPKKSKNKSAVALVGKGVCFDTGGYDVKTGGHMLSMKGDMQGSAVALSSLLTASRLKLPLKLKAFLAVTENHISPKAYHADDVITTMNGVTIEVVNTDAEGRMVLADALCLASRAKPDLIVDFATLTGMAVYSIGTTYSAGFSIPEKLHDKIKSAGDSSGERIWTFPIHKDFAKGLESDVADILQCSKGRGCDHIYAAYFLSQFVEKGIDWVHIDLSAAENKGGLAHTDSEFTGFGVRWTLEFLKQRYRL